MINQPLAGTFHTHLDIDYYYLRPQLFDTTHLKKYFIVQERSLNYGFTLHQHPYVQPLAQRLLRKGTSGLQAADTERAAGEVSLPFGVDVELSAAVLASIPAESRIRLALLASASPQLRNAASIGGNPIALAKGGEFKLTASAPANLDGGSRVTLVAGLAATPYPRTTLQLPAGRQLVVFADLPVTLPNATQLSLPDGSVVTLPAATKVWLTAGTQFQTSANVATSVVRRRMRPPADLYADFFEAAYSPDQALVRTPYPVKDLDFTTSGAYSIYNWELFFHVPLTIAINLSKNQRFAEAQRWFHFLFDPTDDSEGPTPERFWKVRPFQTTDVHKIEEILVNLATGADPVLRRDTINSIETWRNAPFRPHAIARYRQQAYMYKTVMAYLDNLIAWGDSLFRQDTGEAIDEAMMLYVLTANILGPPPLPVPKKGTVRPQTYANLRNDLAQFGTALRALEPDLPFDLMPFPAGGGGNEDRLASVRSLGKALYFCVPRNEKLLGYWDTVADRLFKIRNSLNFQGVFRQLALFEPPIDPAMLARAAAAGLDVGAIVNGLNQPLPLVRFALLVQKAAEVVQEVKSLGNNLLSAMEKEDGEAMALLRARHERAIMDMVEVVKYGQLQEASKAKEGLLQSLALAVQRYGFYERQLGKQPDEVEKAIPALDELDKDSLAKMKFAMKEAEVGRRAVDVDIAQDLGASGGRFVSSQEAEELKKSERARAIHDTVKVLNLAAQGLSLIPDFGIDIQFWGLGGDSSVAGGSKLSQFARFAANIAMARSDQLNYEAGKAAKAAGFARRELDWAFQSNLAAGEISQIFKQLRGAQIREAVAELELKNHRQQMKHAEEIERFLNEEGAEKTGKKANKALYAWIKREVKGLYAQCFQFAFDIAKRAERALQHELGNPELSYLQFGYLAGKEGLLAGERLYLDVKRMEMAYHEQNQREYELVKHVSLHQLDPLALVRLRTTGRCTVRLPESLFDMDGPGHYFRRIKTVAVSIPCVSGPYASINCTLTLLKSSVRKTSVVGDQYARVDSEDDRFSDHFGSMQSIVTSSAQNDSGLFETNLRDERFLPFELAGAISEWQLQLPGDPSQTNPRQPTQFDYDTISDVILHLRYTAREGGQLLRTGALGAVHDLVLASQAAGSVRLFSIRHEFPSEWAAFRSEKLPAGKRAALALDLREEHFPFWSRGRLNGVTRLELLARSAKAAASLDVHNTIDDDAPGPGDPPLGKDSLIPDKDLGNLLAGRLAGAAPGIPLPAKPVGHLELYFDDNELADLWLAITWSE